MRAKEKRLKIQKSVIAKTYGSHEGLECVLLMLLYTALFTLHQKSVLAASKRGIFQG
jgi:hypothetical protein